MSRLFSDTCNWWTILISLHIRSMWETICDAWACWSGWNFGPNSTEYPYSEIQNTPPKMKFDRESKFKSFRIPPPKSPSPGVSEYPPWESKSRSFRMPPPEKNTHTHILCHLVCIVGPPPRVQVQEFQNAPPEKNTHIYYAI